MKHRSVVSNFIFKQAGEQDERLVALFKRSTHPNIHSYQGKFAPIAGSIEQNDVNAVTAARREIREETQLTTDHDLVLVFCGKPYSFEDGDAQRSWTVYPFAWLLLADEDKIQVDWEHELWEWFDPQDVLDGSMDDRSVPRLKDSLQRVYFGPNGMFRDAGHILSRTTLAGRLFLDTMAKLKYDTEHGARVLATEALKGLLKICESFEQQESSNTGEVDQYWYALRTAAYHLIYSARPSMNAAIAAAVVESLSELVPSKHDSRFYMAAICRALTRCIERRGATLDRIAEAFSTYLQMARRGQQEHKTIRIITISASSTILAALEHLIVQDSEQQVELTILESRPACEGASMACAIIKSVQDKEQPSQRPRLSIKVVPESHAALILSDTNKAERESFPTIVLLGADRITPSGHVVNKTGSATLAALSKCLPGAENRKVVVLSEADKIAAPSAEHLSRYQDAMTGYEKGSDTDRLDRLAAEEFAAKPDEAHHSEEVVRAWSAEDQTTWNSRSVLESSGQLKSSGVRFEVKNIYFELVSRVYIDEYVTEVGVMHQKDIMEKSIERAKAEERLFGDLYS